MQTITLRTRCLMLATATCALASGAAHVQSVTLYGLTGTGIGYMSHTNTSGNGLACIPSATGTLPSHWGLRGAEDLGNDVKTVFTLESDFNTDTGISGQGGRLSGQQAQVSLASGYGTITLDRRYSIVFLLPADTDVLGSSQHAIGSLNAYIPNICAGNTIAYKDTFSDLTVGATYSFGHDAADGTPAPGTCAGEVIDNASLCRTMSAMLKYDVAIFDIAGAYEEQRGGTGATASFFNGSAPIAFTDAGDRDRRIVASGYVKFGNAKPGVGWIGRHVQAVAGDVRPNLYSVNGSYPLRGTPTLDAGLARLVNADQSRNAATTVLHGVYALSKRTALYVQTGYLWNSANAQHSAGDSGSGTTPAKDVNQLGAMVRIRVAFR